MSKVYIIVKLLCRQIRLLQFQCQVEINSNLDNNTYGAQKRALTDSEPLFYNGVHSNIMSVLKAFYVYI